MKLTKRIIELICELEEIIGEQCYNPNSYDGWTLEEGCAFRYPVTFDDTDGNEHKGKYYLKGYINKDNLHTMRYKFGSNNIFIGNAVRKVLERLETKYNLDFEELTKTKKFNKPSQSSL